MEALQKDIFTRKGLIDQGSFDCLPSFIFCIQGLARALADVNPSYSSLKGRLPEGQCKVRGKGLRNFARLCPAKHLVSVYRRFSTEVGKF